METSQIILMVTGSIGSLVIGAVTKKFTTVPNGLIPLINGTVATVLFATVGGLGFTVAAFMTGMASAYTATAAYELTKLKPAAEVQ